MTLILEWLTREGHLVFGWWLWISLSGLAVFPLCFRLLAGLPDKGYTLARTMGILLVSLVYWLMASYGFFDNSRGNIVLSWVLVLAGSLIMYARGGLGQDLREWWRENRLLVLVTEILFAAMFLAWAIFRAHQNEILYTEKPMELAFLSAVQRSPSFPPLDPWMSGYAISYYYMGYLMSSMISMMSGISSTIGFNLTIASQFALTGLSAFGVAVNLVRSRNRGAPSQTGATPVSMWVAMGAGLLALLLMTLVGNLQTALIEMPYESRAVPQSYLEFWGTQERANFLEGEYQYDSSASLSTETAQWKPWWWFRASRVLTDYELDDSLASVQPIDEFPAFSFLLADNHPHVLALPFAVTLVGLMLNLVLLRRRPRIAEILLYGSAVGGLVFLNTWDGPIYLLGLIGAEGLRRLLLNNRWRLTIADIAHLLMFGLLLTVILLVVYLPFVIGFRSQAGGLLPNLANPTSFSRLFIMFGPFIVALAMFLLVESWRGKMLETLNWRFAIPSGAIIFVALSLLMLLLALIGTADPSGFSYVSRTMASVGGWQAGIPIVLQRHLENGLTTLLCLLGIVLVLARLFPVSRRRNDSQHTAHANAWCPPATGFTLLLIGMGLCLVMIPEFVYLRDNFGSRINTIFKFYYQAWTVWSLALAYAVYSIGGDFALPRPRRSLRVAFFSVFGFMLLAGILYSVLGIRHRAWIETGRHGSENSYSPPESWDNPIRHVAEGELVSPGTVLFSNGNLNDAMESSIMRARESGVVTMVAAGVRILRPLTLDGGDTYTDPHDYNVIRCLSDLVGRADAVVSEAVLRPYDADYGRVGALTGIPVVLGWENHERQWRGATYGEIAATRREDLEKLYTSDDMLEVSEIITRYEIDYIMYGATERRQYGSIGEDIFIEHMAIVCESNNSRIYAAISLPG